LSQGRPEEVGSVPRIAAEAIEPLVITTLREHHRDQDGDDERALIERSLEQVTVGARAIEIRLAQPDAEPSEEAAGSDAAPPTHAAVISVPWTPTPLRRARDIILPAPQNAADRRPIRAETRATLLRAIASGRRWLEELASGTVAGPAAIATREGCSPRRVTVDRLLRCVRRRSRLLLHLQGRRRRRQVAGRSFPPRADERFYFAALRFGSPFR
jgi:site-specific DNA recombinase